MLGKSEINICDDDSYEEIAAEYQYQMINILNEALSKHGLSQDVRKAICEDFTFDFGMLHDQGEIKLAGSHMKNGKQFEPIIAFLNAKELHLTSEYFSWHEYAFGNVEEALKAPVSKISKLVSLVRKKKD